MLGQSDHDRVHALVRHFLDPSFDREFIATSIIYKAEIEGVPHIGREHIKNRCFDALRARKRELKRNEQMVKMTDATVEEHAEDIVARANMVERLILGRTPFERQLIYLRFYEGLSLEEVAANMSLPRAVVQAALQVAVFKMQQELMGVQ